MKIKSKSGLIYILGTILLIILVSLLLYFIGYYPIAKVNNTYIYKYELDYKMVVPIEFIKKQYGNDYKKNKDAMDTYKTYRKNAIDDLIVETIKIEDFNNYKLEINQNELENIFKEKCSTGNKKIDNSLKFDAKRNLEIEMLNDYILKHNKKKINDYDVKSYYNKNKYLYTKTPGYFHALEIIVKTKQEAVCALNKIINGYDFQKLAGKINIDYTKRTNGDMEKTNYIAYTVEVSDELLNTKVGDITKILKTDYGYAIFKIISKDQITLLPYNQVKDQIYNELVIALKNEVINEEIEKCKKTAIVKIY